MLAGAGVVAVLVGAGVAWVAASGDDDPGSAPSASAPRADGTPSDRSGSDTSADTTSEDTSTTDSQPTTTGAASTPPTPTPPAERKRTGKHARTAVPPARVFAGTGSTWLGTIVVRKPSIVRWSAPGQLSIRFGRERFPVVAPSRAGEVAVPPYSFNLVRVIAKGRWRIRVRPQG